MHGSLSLAASAAASMAAGAIAVAVGLSSVLDRRWMNMCDDTTASSAAIASAVLSSLGSSPCAVAARLAFVASSRACCSTSGKHAASPARYPEVCSSALACCCEPMNSQWPSLCTPAAVPGSPANAALHCSLPAATVLPTPSTACDPKAVPIRWRSVVASNGESSWLEAPTAMCAMCTCVRYLVAKDRE